MTKLEEIYIDTLGIYGSDIPDEYGRAVIDAEHAAADPAFVETLRIRQLLLQSG
jgi:hypothetical protein